MPAHQLAYSKSNLSDWWPVLLGLLVLYIPTFYHLATGLWTAQEQAHGPIILLLSCWLIYRRWPEMIGDNEKIIIINWGWLVFFCGIDFLRDWLFPADIDFRNKLFRFNSCLDFIDQKRDECIESHVVSPVFPVIYDSASRVNR